MQGLDLFETAVGSRVLQWNRVDSRGIEASVKPLSLHADSIDVHGAGIDVVMSEQGEINLIELVKALAAGVRVTSRQTPLPRRSASIS